MATIREKAEEILNEKNTKVLPENIKAGVTMFNVAGALQELVGETTTVTPTTEQQVITPSEGKTGITEVTVTPVDNTIDANIVAENIKKDVTILGVTGTLEEGSGGGSTEGIKQFASVEEMQNSTGNEEGDLALVYAASTANFTVNTVAQIITFPNKVVLPSAYTNNAYTMFRATGSAYFDGQVEISATRFRFDGWGETGEVYITYTSTDGITYNRTDGGDEIVDIGAPIKCAYASEWDDAMGYFMQIASSAFGGLFTYTLSSTENKVKAHKLSAMSIDTSVPAMSCSESIIINKRVRPAWEKAHDELNKIHGITLDSGVNALLIFENTDELTVLAAKGNRPEVMLLDTGNTIVGDQTSIHKAVVNLDTLEITITEITPTRTEVFGSTLSTADGVYDQFKDCYVMCYAENRSFATFYEVNTAEESYTTYDNAAILIPYDAPQYIVAPSQLTLSDASTLLPGKIGYGKEGIVEGNDTFYDNTFDYEKILQNVLNVESTENLRAIHTFPCLVKDDKTYNVLKYVPATLKDHVNAKFNGESSLVTSYSVPGGFDYEAQYPSSSKEGSGLKRYRDFQTATVRIRSASSTYTGEVTVGIQGDTIATYKSTTDNADVNGTVVMYEGVMYRLYYTYPTWTCYKLNGTSRTQVWTKNISTGTCIGDRILAVEGKYVFVGLSYNHTSAGTQPRTMYRVDFTTGTATKMDSHYGSYSSGGDANICQTQNDTIICTCNPKYSGDMSSIHSFTICKADGSVTTASFTAAEIQNAGGKVSEYSAFHGLYGADGKRYIWQRSYSEGHYWEWKTDNTFEYVGITEGIEPSSSAVQFVNGGLIYSTTTAYSPLSKEYYQIYRTKNGYDITIFSGNNSATLESQYSGSNTIVNIYSNTVEYIKKDDLVSTTKGYVLIAGDTYEQCQHANNVRHILLADENN